MGTNYYAVPRTTEEEKEILKKLSAKLPELHIGKSSGGWSFSFHAVRVWDAEDAGLEKEITSYKDWLEVLESGRFEIRDEYNCYNTLDEFKKLVEDKRGGLNHTTEMKKSKRQSDREHAERDCFLDDEGNSFSWGEFS